MMAWMDIDAVKLISLWGKDEIEIQLEGCNSLFLLTCLFHQISINYYYVCRAQPDQSGL